MRKIRVAHVITGLGHGGAEQVLLSIASRLDRTRFEMDVFCVICGGTLVPAFEEAGCRVTVFPNAYDPGRAWPFRVGQALRLAAALRRGRYDIVHTHLFPADVIGRVAGKLAGVSRIVRSLHNMGTWKRARHRVVDRALAPWTDAVICCSEYLREQTAAQEGLRVDAITTIYHGVDTERFQATVDRRSYADALGLRPDRLTVGTVGRVIEAKGHIHLLDAIPAILGEHPETQFLFVGDGPLMPALRDRIRGKPFGERVCFAGSRSDIPELLALMDVFAFPSLTEGLGVAVIEAMAGGRPVVASAIRPISEVVVDGETGLLVPPADPRALAAAVNQLLFDDDLRRRLADAGRCRARERFSQARMTGEIEVLYTRLAGKGRR